MNDLEIVQKAATGNMTGEPMQPIITAMAKLIVEQQERIENMMLLLSPDREPRKNLPAFSDQTR